MHKNINTYIHTNMYIYTHAGAHKFSKNLRATIKFQAPQRWREGAAY